MASARSALRGPGHSEVLGVVTDTSLRSSLSLPWLNETVFVGEDYDLDAVPDVEFAEYLTYVGLDGLFAHDELLGDLGV